MEPEIWMALDRLMQWLVIPAVVIAWHVLGRVNNHEKDILRILTMLEERNARRAEDREDTTAAIKSVHAEVVGLGSRIERALRARRQNEES